MKVIIVKEYDFCGRHSSLEFCFVENDKSLCQRSFATLRKPVIWSPIENGISDASGTSSSQCQFNSILQPKQLPPPGVLGNPPSMLHFPIHSKILF